MKLTIEQLDPYLEAMKLTIEHLAPYLPYELKVIHCIDQINTMEAVTKLAIHTELGHTLNHYSFLEFKPILRNLSNLTKEMVEDCGYNGIKDLINDVRNRDVSIKIWNDLVKNHWDVFFLIEEGLAIDINTLKP